VYGEGQNIWDKYRNVIGIFMRQILEGKPLTIFGDGEQTRAFTYIDDVAPIITRSVYDHGVYGEVFNVGSDDIYTVNELSKLVCEVMGVEADIVHLRERKEVKHAYSDHSKLSKFFDLPEPVGLREGLERMAAWVKFIGWREMEDYVEKEITFNLPEGW
jgi:UDP-glucose 4-epimerase